MGLNNQVCMSREFDKISSKLRRLNAQLAKRLEKAIQEICQQPCQPRGNTVKPLRGDMQGCWRYRVGDYRVIYQFDVANGQITLLSFDHRREAYV